MAEQRPIAIPSKSESQNSVQAKGAFTTHLLLRQSGLPVSQVSGADQHPITSYYNEKECHAHTCRMQSTEVWELPPDRAAQEVSLYEGVRTEHLSAVEVRRQIP